MTIPSTKICLIVLLVSSLTLVAQSLKVRILVNEQQNRVLTQSEIQSLSNIKLVVDGSDQYYYPETNNVFNIPNLSAGVHIIQAVSNDYLFPVLIVDKRVQTSLKMKWLHPLDRKFIKSVNQPFMSPIQKVKYFQPEPSFPILGFLMGGNGLFILMGIVMIFCYKGMNKLAEAQMAPNSQAAAAHPVTQSRRRA